MPDLILSRSMETRFHEGPDGSLLIDVGGELVHLQRDPETGRFHFDHLDLEDLMRGPVPVIKKVARDGEGNFVSFAVGAISFLVVGRKPGEDVYLCEPG